MLESENFLRSAEKRREARREAGLAPEWLERSLVYRLRRWIVKQLWIVPLLWTVTEARPQLNAV